MYAYILHYIDPESVLEFITCIHLGLIAYKRCVNICGIYFERSNYIRSLHNCKVPSPDKVLTPAELEELRLMEVDNMPEKNAKASGMPSVTDGCWPMSQASALTSQRCVATYGGIVQNNKLKK